jgi:hypothetical protein
MARLAWRRPNYATIHRMIENPIYGGAYAYGKTAVAAGYDAAPSSRTLSKTRPMASCTRRSGSFS